MSVLLQGVMKSTSLGAIFLATGSFTSSPTDIMPASPPSIAQSAEPPVPPPESSIAENVENFRKDFLHRVAGNKQTFFNMCFTRTSAAVRKENVAAIRNAGPVVTKVSFNQRHIDYTLEPIVVLDRGHGHETPGSPYGYDTGAIRDKVIEARVVDSIATPLKEKLDAQGIHVVETRGSLSDGITMSDRYRFRDQDRALQWRAELSYELTKKYPDRAVIFLSLHANSALSTRPKGAEIFYYEGAGSYSTSADFARSLNMHYRIPSGGRVMSEDFGVLRCQHAQTPAVLLELGYLSNPGDRAFLRGALHDEGKAGRIADMIADGVSAYLDKKRKEQKPDAPVMVADLGNRPRL